MSLAFFLGIFPQLLQGTWITLEILFLSGAIGNLLAIGVALARVSRNPFVNTTSYFYTLLMRGTPLLVQIYLLYYGLGSIFAHMPAIHHSFLWPYLREGFWYGVVALSLNTAGYTGEILRGAILAVPHGEIEAARAFGMSKWLVLRRVTLPRAYRICLPTLVGETILLLKSTPLVYTITVLDMMGVANFIRVQTFRVYEPLLAAALIYIFLTFVLTRFFRWLEARLNRDRVAPVQVATAEPRPDLQPNL
ncbi:MAG TPA: ABC transporter permease [Dongiaceae bacterium]|nr:ABC transporter permease [Dongiaceae bacterium]